MVYEAEDMFKQNNQHVHMQLKKGIGLFNPYNNIQRTSTFMSESW